MKITPLGAAIKRLRNKADLTKAQLADCLDCRQETIWQMETGRAKGLSPTLREAVISWGLYPDALIQGKLLSIPGTKASEIIPSLPPEVVSAQASALIVRIMDQRGPMAKAALAEALDGLAAFIGEPATGGILEWS